MSIFKVDDTFLIAEVGQNHQGDIDKAREYIRTFAYEGADAIKFQTRNNKFFYFQEDAYQNNYNSENSFGKTYGEHREKLELSEESLQILKRLQEFGVKFMSTPFDEPSFGTLERIDVDIIKIASFDLGNLSFL